MTTTKPYPSWICHACGIRFGRREPHCATFHDGHCDVCGTNAAVTQPRDYGHLNDGWKEMSDIRYKFRVTYEIPPIRGIKTAEFEELAESTDSIRAMVETQNPSWKINKIERGIVQEKEVEAT